MPRPRCSRTPRASRRCATSSRPQQAPAPLRSAGGHDARVLPRRPRARRPRRPAARDACARAASRSRPVPRAAGERARDDLQDGFCRVLPDRLGLHRLRAQADHSRRARPRLRRRLARRVRAAHHRHRSDRAQPLFRALPQSRACVDAGLRHRLLHEPPRRGHPLCRGEVRQGQRRANDHPQEKGRNAIQGRRARDGLLVRQADQISKLVPEPIRESVPLAGAGRRPR